MKNQKLNNEILIYEGDDGETRIETRFEAETLWLSQKQMAELFDCTVDNVSLHMKNIFKDGELNENSVVEEYSVTAVDGKNYFVKHYNLDAIISIGYRINSLRGTKFRIWATARLKEYNPKSQESIKFFKTVQNKLQKCVWQTGRQSWIIELAA